MNIFMIEQIQRSPFCHKKLRTKNENVFVSVLQNFKYDLTILYRLYKYTFLLTI